MGSFSNKLFIAVTTIYLINSMTPEIRAADTMVDIRSPVEGEVITGNKRINLFCCFDPTNNSSNQGYLSVYVDTELLFEDGPVIGGGFSFRWHTPEFEEMVPHTITAVASDINGSDSDSVTVYINNPLPEITSPLEGELVQGRIDIRGDLFFTQSNALGYYSLYIDGEKIIDQSCVFSGGNQLLYRWYTPEDEDFVFHTITLEAISWYRPDRAHDTIFVFVDNVPPFGKPQENEGKNFGYQPGAMAADPIHVVTGNMFYRQRELFIPSTGMPLHFFRAYNSRDDYSGPFGWGWTHSYNINLSEEPDGVIVLQDEDGTRLRFSRGDDRSYTPPPGVHALLRRNADRTFTLTRKHKTVYLFDPEGRLASITDRNGNRITLEYDSRGSLTALNGPAGRRLLLTCDTDNRIVGMEDASGRKIDFDYDDAENLTGVVYPDGSRISYAYDTGHNLISITDAEGNRTHFEYDENDRAVRTGGEEGTEETTFSFRPEESTTVVTNSRGYPTTYRYDAECLITEIVDCENNRTSFGWDDSHNLVSRTDATGAVSIFSYDGNGNLISAADALGNITTFTYDPEYDFIVATVDPAGAETKFSYDENGNLIETEDALGGKTTFRYDNRGNLLALTDPNDNMSAFGYDSFGNLTSVTDAYGDISHFTYDRSGNRLGFSDAEGNTFRFEYDECSRLSKINYPDGTATNYGYDRNGRLISGTDQTGDTTSYSYDSAGKLTRVIDPLGNVVTYGYDSEGNLVGLTDANGCTITYCYDSLNRLIELTSASGREKRFDYDCGGNVTSVRDGKGQEITYSYDDNKQLLRKCFPDGSTVCFSYDSCGRCASMADGEGTTVYAYDLLGRLLEVDGPGEDDAVSYSYDKAGNRKELTVPGFGTTAYNYDRMNRLVELIDPWGQLTVYDYDRRSNLRAVYYPNGSRALYRYDQMNRLLELINQDGKGEVFSSFTYQYDRGGKITRVAMSDGTSIEYNYDGLNRLLSEVKKGDLPAERIYYRLNYTYDAAGNRAGLRREYHQRPAYGRPGRYGSQHFPGRNFAYSGLSDQACFYNEDQQLVRVKVCRDEGEQTIDYSYDDNGNLIEKTDGSRTISFTYDYENRLTAVCSSGLPLAKYRYDGIGRRVGSLCAGKNTDYIYDGLEVLLVRENDEPGKSAYIRGHSRAGGIGSIISCLGGDFRSGTRFYHYDGRGSVINLTGAEGDVKMTYACDGFGNVLSQDSTDIYGGRGGADNPFLFSTKEYESISGLYYFGARYYDPAVGRFLTRDIFPVNLYLPETLHCYTYCANDPVNYVDPLGLCRQTRSRWWLWGPENWLWQYVYGGGEWFDPKFRQIWREEFHENRLPIVGLFSVFPAPRATIASIGLHKTATGLENYAKSKAFASVKTVGSGNFAYFSGVPAGMKWGQASSIFRVGARYINYATAFATGADIGSALRAYYAAYSAYYGE